MRVRYQNKGYDLLSVNIVMGGHVGITHNALQPSKYKLTFIVPQNKYQ